MRHKYYESSNIRYEMTLREAGMPVIFACSKKWLDMTRILLCVFALCHMALMLHARGRDTGRTPAVTDSLANDFRSVVSRNFSRYRTVNMSWEMKAAHNYTFTTDGKEMEKGRKQNLHTLRFSTMIPVLRQRRLSLYANVQYAGHVLDCAGKSSAIFSEHSYSHYSGGISASYLAELFNRPLILSADISADGWDGGWGMLQGRFVAALVFSKGRNTGLTLGIAGMTLGRIPVLPVIAYRHSFHNPDWSVDISLPSQFYLRNQRGCRRISIGGNMSGENFYLRTSLPGVPSVCYYSEVVLKTEVMYEYIINRHFYISARAGLSTVIKGALYTKGRKELDAETEQKRSPMPFFNAGISYSLFK